PTAHAPRSPARSSARAGAAGRAAYRADAHGLPAPVPTAPTMRLPQPPPRRPTSAASFRASCARPRIRPRSVPVLFSLSVPDRPFAGIAVDRAVQAIARKAPAQIRIDLHFGLEGHFEAPVVIVQCREPVHRNRTQRTREP